MKVYFDNAATTSVSRTALEAMLPCLTECWGNPSSLHAGGREAGRLLDGARVTVAECLGAQPSEILFTSGGTEADCWAITQGAALGAAQGKRHLISTPFEHHAVLNTLHRLEKQGFSVSWLNVHEDGLVRPEEVASAIREDTALVSVMYANNEIGTIQPVAEIGRICQAKGVLFHTDAVQAAGHLSIDVVRDQIDLMSISGHKFHGPKGVGALYCRRGVRLGSLLEGGGQERGKRPGTENLAGICGMAAALREACAGMAEDSARVLAMRKRLTEGVLRIPYSRLNGGEAPRLPGNTNFSFAGVDGESLLLRLDMAGICASSGSACMSGSLEPSHVLLALGLDWETAKSGLRLTLDAENRMEEVDYVLELLPGIVRSLRQVSSRWKQLAAQGTVKEY